MPDSDLWEQNGEDHRRIEGRVDATVNRLWWLLGLLVPIMVAGIITAFAVYADTQTLKTTEKSHATKDEVEKLRAERRSIDAQQTRALNWQTQAIESIANKLDADLPSRPPMIEDR